MLQDLQFAVRLLIKDKWFTLVADAGAGAGHRRQRHGLHVRQRRADPRPAVRRSGSRSWRSTRATRCAIGTWACPTSISRTGARRRKTFSALAAYTGSDDERQRRGPRARAIQRLVHVGQRVPADRPDAASSAAISCPRTIGPGAPAVVMLGNGVWKNRYGSDPGVSAGRCASTTCRRSSSA